MQKKRDANEKHVECLGDLQNGTGAQKLGENMIERKFV